MVSTFKGGYLDFSDLIQLKNIYITEIYIKREYKSSRIKTQKITKKLFWMGVPLKGYVASKVIFRFGARNEKHYGGNIQ